MLERRSWNTRYLSRRAFQNNFFLSRWQRVYSRRARSSLVERVRSVSSIHRDFFYLAAARRGRSVEISPRLSLSRNSLLSGFRCSFETDPPPPPPPPLTVVSRTRLITTSDDEPGFELFHGRFSNCETPTRYQATTDSSNSVIRTEAVRGGLSLRCHARKRKNARSYKIVNHSADPPLFRETSLLLSLPSRGSNPLMIRGSEKRRKGDSSRTSCVTRKRIVKRDNLSMRGDGILV